MELDFSVLDNIKSDALNCPASIGKNEMRTSISEKAQSQPQSKYEGEKGISFNKLEQIRQDNKKQAEIYQKEQENIKKAGDMIPEITKGILAADNPLVLLLKAIECIGIMTGNNAFYSQSLNDIKTVYGIGLHDPQAIEIELQETDSRLAKLWAAINEATPEEQKNLERAIKAHEQKIEYLKRLAG
ncbi:MAG: hypothetical protein EOL93_06000 [Epsilonproteobacteria bacterium]|nr:hypothetical protein [Campylobacterota bacterium]